MILQTAMLNTKVSLLDNGKNGMVTYFLSSCKESCTTSIGGSVVECSPATRAARVRFPADAPCDGPVPLRRAAAYSYVFLLAYCSLV